MDLFQLIGRIIVDNTEASVSHAYAATGQFLVKVITVPTTCCLTFAASQNQLIVKIGSEIRMDYNEGLNSTTTLFSGAAILRWAVIYGKMSGAHYSSGFQNCGSLKRIDFKNKLSGDLFMRFNSTFFNFKDVDFSEITSIGNSIFWYCYNLKRIYAPNCTSVGDTAFSHCSNLEEAVFADGCTFGKNCFEDCHNLKRLSALHCNSVSAETFIRCFNLEEIILNDCLSIERNAFSNCNNLKRIYAPNCTSVGDTAFSHCSNLEEAVFADGCTFGKNCFEDCHNLYPRPDGSTY